MFSDTRGDKEASDRATYIRDLMHPRPTDSCVVYSRAGCACGGELAAGPLLVEAALVVARAHEQHATHCHTPQPHLKRRLGHSFP